jgi:hypothetical protein
MPNFPIGFNADPDTGRRTNADPATAQVLKITNNWINHKKLNFNMNHILTEGNRSKNVTTKVQKPFWKEGNPVYL